MGYCGFKKDNVDKSATYSVKHCIKADNLKNKQ